MTDHVRYEPPRCIEYIYTPEQVVEVAAQNIYHRPWIGPHHFRALLLFLLIALSVLDSLEGWVRMRTDLLS